MRHFLILSVMAALLAAPAFSAVIPRPAPELAVNLLGGKSTSLSKYRGKVVAFMFLLTGCSHCQQAAQTLSKIRADYQSKGFEVVGAAINDDAAQHIGEFIQQNKVDFPVGMVNRDKAYEFLQQSLMMSMPMPQLVFIDRKGTIRAQYGGTSPFFTDEERNMRTSVESLLKEPAGASAAKSKKGKK